MNLDRTLEFDKVKEIWQALAVTEHAKKKIENAGFVLAELELRKELKDTTNARELIERLGTPPLQNVTEIKDVMEIAKKGDCLTPYQLEKVGMILTAVRRLKDYLDRGKMFENPLAYYEENFDCVDDLREEIARQIRNVRT